MNNDKRIILAIALYAAVITMVLHTLSSEGHPRYNGAKNHAIEYNEKECSSGLVSTMPGRCSENECGSLMDNAGETTPQFVEKNATSLELDDDAHS